MASSLRGLFVLLGEMMRTTPFKGPLGVLIVTPFAPSATMAPRVLEDRVGLEIL